MPTPTDPAHIDKRQARRAFSRAAGTYDAAAVLQRRMADDMLERLHEVRIEPRAVLDLGTGTGYALDGLLKRFPKARVLAVDFAHPMLGHARRRGRWLRRPACVCADFDHLPFGDGALDLIYSNATLQWSDHLRDTLAELRRVLRPGGLLIFTTFGPDTLKELRWAWSQADGHPHVSGFLDMHDVGDDLVHAGFADPVLDVDRLTLTYEGVDGLMRDLKTIGAQNAVAERPRGLTGKGRLAAMRAAYETLRRDGRLPASYEVVHAHAWVPEAGARPQGPAAEAFVPADAIRRLR